MDYRVTSPEGNRYDFRTGELNKLDIVRRPGDGGYHLLLDERTYRCELLWLDAANKSVAVRVNERVHTFKLDDRYDLVVRELGFSTESISQSDNLEAPMPGLVLDLLVAEGDEVEEGSPLIILEAMKMENLLKASGPGTVGTIHVSKGQAVDKRQLLIELL